MKTLLLKKRYAWALWSGLKSLPTKEYANDEEVQAWREEIKPIFEADLVEHVQADENILEVRTKFQSEVYTEEQADKMLKDIQKSLSKWVAINFDKDTAYEFENRGFNILFQFFQKKGKDWFTNVDDFWEVREKMNETNRQPKDDSKEESKEDKKKK